MANFFNPITGDDITAMDVKDKSKFRLGLRGGGPGPNYDRLNVTTNPATAPNAQLMVADPAVHFIKETAKGSWDFIYEIDSTKMQGTSVRACWNNSDYSEPVVVELESVAKIRESIVDLARTFVADAHYLWGTAGNQPGLGDGNHGGGKQFAAKMRDPGLDAKETARDKVLAVRIAVQPTFDGYNTCAGRNENFTEKPDLNAFLRACQDSIAKGTTDQTKWEGAGAGKNLFPRKYYFRGTLKNPTDVVWGEACDGVRHFDCVGLVNYCYARHWYQPNFGCSIPQFRLENQGTTKIDDKKDLADADILIKPGDGHIGMLYDTGAGWNVVQANWTTKGLTDTERYDSAKWDRYRMNSAYLVGKHS
jgi:hypothetical protein